MRNATEAVISPDGRYVAFLVGEWSHDEQKQRTRLWLAATEGGEAQPLTSGKRNDKDPCWSPDSRFLAFTSKVDWQEGMGKAQLYRFDTHTFSSQHAANESAQEPEQICTMPNGINTISWSPDGKRIAFFSPDGQEATKDPYVQRPGLGQYTRLWTVQLYPAGNMVEPITPAGFSLWNYAWSPDSQNFAIYYNAGTELSDWYRGQIGLLSSHGGAIEQVGQLTRQAFALTWSPDNSKIAYVSGEWSDPDRGGGDIFIYSLRDQQTRNLTPDITWSPAWCRWTPAGTQLLCAGWDGFGTQIALIDEASAHITTLERDFLIGDHHWPHLSVTSDFHSIAVTHSDNHPYDAWTGRLQLAGETPRIDWQRVTRLNPIAEETLASAETSYFSYTGADDWRIEAAFTAPLHGDTQVLPPLVVQIHGGPSGVWVRDWDNYRCQALAAAGFAVFRPNIRGGTGRGVAFADAVIGDMGGKDLQDIVRGIDYLVERKLVDPERVGIMGWSYGGFMVSWAITQTTRFKAAVMGAGISDFHSFHAQTNIQDWDMRYLGSVSGTVAHPASPLSDAEIYRAHSSISYAKQVQTPTLIVHGEQDSCVPVNQAHAFYRALQEQQVPVELVIYPREDHGPVERQHILDYMQRSIGWFKRYLLNEK